MQKILGVIVVLMSLGNLAHSQNCAEQLAGPNKALEEANKLLEKDKNLLQISLLPGQGVNKLLQVWKQCRSLQFDTTPGDRDLVVLDAVKGQFRNTEEAAQCFHAWMGRKQPDIRGLCVPNIKLSVNFQDDGRNRGGKNVADNRHERQCGADLLRLQKDMGAFETAKDNAKEAKMACHEEKREAHESSGGGQH